MVERQIEPRGVRDALVLEAMRVVPRHEFCLPAMRESAYADHPLQIGCGQTISQPYIVAAMTELLGLGGGEKVLEVGTGSGYQTAVLAHIGADVYTVEILPELAARARETLDRLGYASVHTRCGDATEGWPEHAPYDAIIVTCAPGRTPPALTEQLAEGGRLVIPVGPRYGGQWLRVLRRVHGEVNEERVMQVRFVPMTGAIGEGG